MPPPRFEGVVHLLNVIDSEIHDRAWMHELLILWHIEQKANAITVEEGQPRWCSICPIFERARWLSPENRSRTVEILRPSGPERS
jgi:hypothetical protein